MEDPTIKWASSQNDPKNAADLSTYRGDFVLRSDLRGTFSTKSGVFCAEEGILEGCQNKKRGVLCWGGHFGRVSAQNVGCFVLREAFWRGVRTKCGVFCSKGGVLEGCQNKMWGILCWRASDDVNCRHHPTGGQPLREVAARTAGAEHPAIVYAGCGDTPTY